MKLLGSIRSPYVQKVRVALAEKGLACDCDEVSAASPEVAAQNPLAKVPALIRDDGSSLYDSSVIIEYLDGIAPGPKLIPTEFAPRIEVRRWEALGDGVMDATVAISHENREPLDKRKGPEFYAKQQHKIDAGLAMMARDLGASTFCHGDGFTLADIACGCALAYLDRAHAEYDWRAAFPTLAAHLQRLMQRPSFTA